MTQLNVDMIYAVPGQTAESWCADLERVLALGSEHLSAYNLTFEEETLFKRWLDQGRLVKSTEDVELESFTRTRELTAAHGLAAYEISNFARAGQACEHNLNYWRNGAYAGIGPSAVSKLGNARFGNVKAIRAYARRASADEDTRLWEETPDERTRLAETWWLGLRLAEGISPAEARARAAVRDVPDEVDSGAVVARELAGHDDVAVALRSYEARRRDRVDDLQRGARRLGAVAQWRSPLARWARDLAVRCTPAASSQRALEKILAHVP